MDEAPQYSNKSMKAPSCIRKEIQTLLSCLGMASGALLLSGCVVGEGLNALSQVGVGRIQRYNRQREVEQVARDWCLTIRGSQVIPVYPLDEDVQPGDLYIVDTPVDEMKKYWHKQGYLPIDHRFGRFYPQGYKEYYKGGYGLAEDEEKSPVPRNWQFPITPKPVTGPNEDRALPVLTEEQKKVAKDQTDGANKSLFTNTTLWPAAPRAGFPSQTIRIRKGEGFNCALPLQGVPVALGALGARESIATVSLNDAYTYGLDEITMRREMQRWLNSDASANQLLMDYRSAPGPEKRGLFVRNTGKRYLRLVTRVYLVRSVSVSVSTTNASDWKLSVGAAKEAEASGKTAADFVGGAPAGTKDRELEMLQALNGLMTSHTLGTPGGTGDTKAKKAEEEKPAADELADENFEGEEMKAKAKRLRELSDELTLLEEEDKLNSKLAQIEQSRLKRESEREIFERSISRTLMKDKFGGYQLPGGTLRVTSATSRSISMNETFTRPLVVGYHALDFRIEPDGSLSAPVSTFSRLTTDNEPQVVPVLLNDDTKIISHWLQSVKTRANWDILEKWLTDNQINIEPAQFPTDPGHVDERRNFVRYLLRSNRIR